MMIVVVEGINAAGKTTWCRSHGQSYLIPETGNAETVGSQWPSIRSRRSWAFSLWIVARTLHSKTIAGSPYVSYPSP
ncbi:hypothetical protein GOB19_29355 [Sinorhizobium meliloti]|nr:hypothetical protein [Sinorhizobium meliloti]MDX0116430.1 hypothetical protein [Sinorhizobium meliloti]MDX0307897.1 hypothetical protein [Sinorhizobium meliloti]